MPASTSSNTSVAAPASSATLISASITRESSPPEAVSRSGPAGTPGLGAIRKSTSSPPVGPYPSRGVTRGSNDAPSLPAARPAPAARRDARLERRPLHRQPRQPLDHGAGERTGRPAPRRPQPF